MESKLQNIENLNQIREETKKCMVSTASERHTGPTPSAPTGGGRRRWPAFGMARVTGGARLSRRILADLRRWHERRKNVRDLSALDDRLLKDIGIGRSKILYVVQEGARLSIPDGRSKLAPNACAPIQSPGTRRVRAAG